ncbi:molybdate ABC transporter substrate-binding protein [Roseimarinus sediminis]|jgi:molybdate transport system substrate-binding protein|uniref:molybdate ABC transporter substrate-binding protein n=1 Tax=Roseimarinus sediminis TaxID=1610899 RepID=UPI003D25B90A
MKFILPVFRILLLLLWLQGVAGAQKLTIATAANFREPMSRIIEHFEAAYPEVEVVPVFASSGTLFHQIMRAAPYDLFYSADSEFPQKLFEAGRTYETPQIYAEGHLVLWSRKIDVRPGISVLSQHANLRMAIANPDLAPYGKSAVAFLKYHHLYAALKKRLIIAENIGQTAQFVISGNADCGILAKSQLSHQSIAGKGFYHELDRASYKPIEQAYVAIKRDGNKEVVEKFVGFTRRPEILEIISAYGYETVRKN